MAGCKPFSVDLSADQSSLPHYQPPPCQVACPIGTDVGSYVGLIWDDNKEAALEAITATNPARTRHETRSPARHRARRLAGAVTTF